MPVSAIYVLDHKGKALISRNYRSDVPLNVADKFVTKILNDDDDLNVPIIDEDGIFFLYIKISNLYLLAVTNRNADATMVLLFLHRASEVFRGYFKEIEEESIRDNFVIIYELLDEMMDFGYPQTTETKILQEYITQESYKLEGKVLSTPPPTGAVGWRGENIKHKTNEVFLDVIESVNLLVHSNGVVLRSEVVGTIKVNARLSGMPQLRLGLNDRLQFESQGRSTTNRKTIEMEDVNFHQCVQLSRFENDRTISFIPPDGEFELMSYRLNVQIKPLIWIETVIESHKNSRVEYLIKARSQFRARSMAQNVEIQFPVPLDADSPKFKASIGQVKYVPEKDSAVWTIKQFQGGKEYLMRAHFGLPSIRNDDIVEQKPPITVKFQIPYLTVSGIRVRYLKIVEKSNYPTSQWVKYITQNGDCIYRI